MVWVRVAFHENDRNHENDENDEDNSDSYKQGVERWIRGNHGNHGNDENHGNPGCKPPHPTRKCYRLLCSVQVVLLKQQPVVSLNLTSEGRGV